MSGIIAVHHATGDARSRIAGAATLADSGIRVQAAADVDVHEAPELTVFVADHETEAARFREVVAESVACRSALLVLVPDDTPRSAHGRWLDAGAWGVISLSTGEGELASHIRAALRVARGARATPGQMLATLRESEERNRAILEAAVDGIITIDERGIVDSVNPAAARMFGYTAAELVGSSINRLMPSPYAEHHDGYLRDYIRTGQNKIIGIGREAVGLRRDGTQFPLYLAVSEVRIGTGRLFTGIVRDISERKKHEAELARLAAAIHQAAEAIVITDPSPAIQYVNPGFERDTGYTAAEAVGQNPRILKSGQHGADFYERLWRRLGRGEVWSGHLINKRKDGTLIDCQQVITPIVNAEGKITNYVSVWRDVTREMQLEDQVRRAQKMESVGRLAGGIAHDFNNLLTAILGLGSLARESVPAGHPAVSYLDDMMRAARRSAHLTQQLLTFSRKHLAEMKPLRLRDVVEGIEHLLRRVTGENVELVTRLADGVGCFEGDNDQIGQVLMNLVINARDAMPGGGRIEIVSARTTLTADDCDNRVDAKPGDYVVVSVRDTGHGMTRETMDHIFEPFFTTKAEGKGTGLGLSMVYSIVRQHHGFINVISEVGVGTAFEVHLPATSAPAAIAAEAAETAAPRGVETLLVVEDESVVRRATTEMLSSLGYLILTAATPEEALAVFEDGKAVDLVLSDVVMPRMGGFELAKLIQAVRPEMRFLFMSGFAEDHFAEEGTRHAILGKPFNRTQLGRRVRQVLDIA